MEVGITDGFWMIKKHFNLQNFDMTVLIGKIDCHFIQLFFGPIRDIS